MCTYFIVNTNLFNVSVSSLEFNLFSDTITTNSDCGSTYSSNKGGLEITTVTYIVNFKNTA